MEKELTLNEKIEMLKVLEKIDSGMARKIRLLKNSAEDSYEFMAKNYIPSNEEKVMVQEYLNKNLNVKPKKLSM